MTIDTILKTLKSASYVVGFDDHDILIDLPDGGIVNLDDGLRADVLQQKQEILFFLRSKKYNQLRAQAESLGAYLDDTSILPAERGKRLAEYEDIVKQIAALEPVIQHYEESGLSRWYGQGWFLLHSDLLNEIIVIVRDPSIKLPAGCSNYPVYQPKEVTALDGKTDEVIKAAHSAKKVFSGQVKGGKK